MLNSLTHSSAASFSFIHTCSGNFDVLDDDLDMQNLRVWLEDKAKKGTKLWQSDSGASEGTFSMTMEPGLKLELCFDGQWGEEEMDDAFEDGAEVGFNVRVHAIPRSLPDEENGPDMERALRITEAAVSIETDWSNLMDHFEFLRSREAVHMRLTSEILDRLMGWTLLEAAVVILMAVGQVMYWRKFFEQRRYL